eukprot:513503_1
MGANVTFSKQDCSDYYQAKFSEGDTIKSKVVRLFDKDREVWIEGKIKKKPSPTQISTALCYDYSLYIKGKDLKENQKIYVHNYNPNLSQTAEENQPQYRYNYPSAYRLYDASGWKGPNVYWLGSTSTQIAYGKNSSNGRYQLWAAKRVSLVPFDCKMRQIPY